MSDIEILNEYPVIFTKDRDWVESRPVVKPGSIVVLPDDAILCVPPVTISVTTDQPNQDGIKGGRDERS